ncbi:exo-poly-alpha-D-galacturonosidase [Bacteroidia bacterium]|nr:exo-poly-alpha-D-galacturonosidase [Bacteroidia bacterium]
MRKIVLAALAFIVCSCVSTTSSYNIRDFGAKGDGATIATEAIQKAIDKCAAKGGGVVSLPAGDYLVGTLNLRSCVEFHFEPGARLVATTDLTQYQRHNDELAGVFYTEDAHDVAITGRGVIFGQGMEFMFADSAKVIGPDDRRLLRQGDDFRKVKSGVGDGPLYPKDRFHQMVIFSNCTDVTLTDFACIDAPYWTFLIVHCDRVRASGLKIDNDLLIPNSDGLDVISSSNVNISDCYFSCGDDAIVLAGYDWHFGDPGFKRIHRPSTNINVSNCILRSRSSAIRIGGWDQNPMSNYFFNNIIIFDSNAGINFNVRDSGGIENVFFNNVRIETRLHTGDWWGNGEPIRISAMRGVPDSKLGIIKNVFFTNISCNAENSIVLLASDESAVENVSFVNFDFNLKRSALEEVGGGNIDLRPNIVQGKSFYASDIPIVLIENATNVRFDGGSMTWDKAIDKPYYTNAIAAVGVKGLRIDNTNGTASPSNPKLPPVGLVNCTGVVNNINR